MCRRFLTTTRSPSCKSQVSILQVVALDAQLLIRTPEMVTPLRVDITLPELGLHPFDENLSADPMFSNSGLATSPTRSAYLILPARKITTVSVPCHTPKPTYSSSASASPHPHPSRTSARNGSPKFTTTALVCPASSLAPKSISVTTRRSARSWRSSACHPFARRTVSAWRKIWVRSSTSSARH